MRRVVITGIGTVTCLGVGCAALWRGLLAGRSGISTVTSFDTSRYQVHKGAEITDFDPAPFVKRMSPRALGRTTALAIAAARLALEDATLDPAMEEPSRCAVFTGTTSGESLLVERFDDCYIAQDFGRVTAEFINNYPSHVLAARVSQEFAFTGPCFTIPTACAAGNYAIAYGFDALREGRVDLVLAGGADAFSRITYTGFARLGAIAPERCQPFDRCRKGMVPGEGAAMLTLEPLDRAAARGAHVYAEVVGYGLSCDAHHMTAGHPDAEGAIRATRQALAVSGLAPESVSYISAHGTGTAVSDRLETLAVKRVFGDAAYDIPMSSIKSMIGHAMGAASAIEAAACAMAIESDCVPPTINLEDPDPECDLDYVPGEPRSYRVDVAVNNAYAFGGMNTSLVLKKPDF